MTVGRLPLLPLSLAFLAFVIAPPVTAVKFPSALDPRDLISDGRLELDNALLLPLSGQLASNQINGLLVPSKLWPREQESICATNYTTCVGTGFCCPDGNVCCSGESLMNPRSTYLWREKGCGL